jgi:hypothetical protein
MIDIDIRRGFLKELADSRSNSDGLIKPSTSSVEKAYGDLFDELQTIIGEYDVMSLFCFGATAAEYDLEVKTIIIQLDKGMNEQQVLNIIHQEFVLWFGEELIGSKDTFSDMSNDVYQWLKEKQ